MAEQLIGPYKVVREIGRGGMGSVYEAVHPQIQRRVAIKVLHPQFAKNEQLVTRFFKEARAVNIVNHPSVVQISEFAQLPDGTAYIVMEFLEGESLGVRMKRNGGRLSLVESLRMSRQIAAALAAAHSKGIIHRDLKPDNVMIVSDPEAPGGERAKVLDFGIAKFASAANPTQVGADAIEQMSQTQSGVMIGTPLYMAPEQCKGAVNVDDKADVYSLGVMLYRMLCGRPPFIGEGAGSVMAMHIYEPAPPLRDFEPSIPEDLAALVHRLLVKDPTQRPPMLQVAQALEQLKALHTTGMLSSMELARVQQSGVLQAITPIPTPIPLSASQQVSAVGAHQMALHQTGHSHVSALHQSHLGQSQVGALVQSHHGLTPVNLSQSNPSHGGTPSSGNGVSVSQTFGHSAAQIAPEQGRRGVLVAVLGASVLLGAALFGIVALRQSDPPKDKDSNLPEGRRPVVQQPIRKVRFQVASEPPGATVVRAIDQRELGQTPWSNEQPAGSGSLVLILRRTGYADRIVTLDQSANAVIKEALQALPSAPTPPAPNAPTVRFVKKGGKRVAVPVAPPPVKGPATTAQAPAGTSAPTPPTQPPPPVKQSPPPKEEPSHARIQMVD